KKTVDKQREEQLSKEKKETVAIEGYDIPDEKQKHSEVKVSAPKTNLSDDIKPQVKIVGNIDLDDLKAKPKKKQEVEKKEEKQATAGPKVVEKEADKAEVVDKKVSAEKEADPIEQKPKEKEPESAPEEKPKETEVESTPQP